MVKTLNIKRGKRGIVWLILIIIAVCKWGLGRAGAG